MQEAVQQWRDWLANHIGVDESRKQVVYLEVAQAATLLDVTYWLQIIFAAGIATLGLVLNSPAVIIGAMLISPLMSPILSMGLALASGDLILAIRSLFNLLLSSGIAILFSITLVFLLPFKEVTTEILGRTQPNILDLGIALFSGAVGTISTCKPIRGVVNSIPGAAIAVALMPPLCVVGFGLGVAFSHNLIDGLRISSGGGLLFLTNLVAITFTAMLCFLGLHIDTPLIKQKIKDWEKTDRESLCIQQFFGKYQILRRLRPMGSLPGRLLMILSVIALLVIPLEASFERLGKEVKAKQEENRIKRVVRDSWNTIAGLDQDGNIRSYLNQVAIQNRENELILNLNVFTYLPLSPRERNQYVESISTLLNKPQNSIKLNLIELPSTPLNEQDSIATTPISPPSLEAKQQELLTSINNSLGVIPLPPSYFLVTYRFSLDREFDRELEIVYCGDQRMSQDAQAILSQSLQERLAPAVTKIKFTYIKRSWQITQPKENQTTLPTNTLNTLNELTGILLRYPTLNLEILVSQPHTTLDSIPLVGTYLSLDLPDWESRVNLVTSPNTAEFMQFRLISSAADASPPFKAALPRS